MTRHNVVKELALGSTGSGSAPDVAPAREHFVISSDPSAPRQRGRVEISLSKLTNTDIDHARSKKITQRSDITPESASSADEFRGHIGSESGYSSFLRFQDYTDASCITNSHDLRDDSLSRQGVCLESGLAPEHTGPHSNAYYYEGISAGNISPITNASSVCDVSTNVPSLFGGSMTSMVVAPSPAVAKALTNSEVPVTLASVTVSITANETPLALITNEAVYGGLANSSVVNVKAYGAKGNGLTDDTAAIQAAAKAAAAQGKQLYFPPGTYLVSQTLIMASQEIWTADVGTATLEATDRNTLIDAVATRDDQLIGLRLEGSSDSSSDSPPLLVVYKSFNFALDDDAVTGTAGIGTLFSDVNESTVNNCSFTNVGNDPTNLLSSNQGVVFTNDLAGYGNANVVSDSNFTDIGLDAVSATGQIDFEAIANTINFGSVNLGWASEPRAAAGVYGGDDTELFIADNSISNASGNGIDTYESSSVEVFQNTVTGSGGAGIGVFSDTTATVSENTTMDNNTLDHFDFTAGISIDMAGSIDVAIEHNISGNNADQSTQLYGVQVLNGQLSNPANLSIDNNNALSSNLIASVSDPSGTYSSANLNVPVVFPVAVVRRSGNAIRVARPNLEVTQSSTVNGGIVVPEATTKVPIEETATVPCFVKGTMIATPQGEVPVEILQPGDTILTAFGEILSIVWAGRRVVNCATHLEPEHVRPICIQAHSFARGTPRRDLLLSPDHSIFAFGVLIPAKHLVNGKSIRQVKCHEVSYHHLELVRHTVMLAEGLAAESYLEIGDRSLKVAAHPNELSCHGTAPNRPEAQMIRDALACAPIKIVGPEVEQVRRRLNRRAGVRRELATERQINKSKALRRSMYSPVSTAKERSFWPRC